MMVGDKIRKLESKLESQNKFEVMRVMEFPKVSQIANDY